MSSLQCCYFINRARNVVEPDTDDEDCDEPTEEEIQKWKAERKLEKARRVSRVN